MQISRSFGWRTLATLVVALIYVSLYEATIRDSQETARQAAAAGAQVRPQAGAQLGFIATAYCKGETTASGVAVRTGIAAADPALLPVGTVVRVDLPDSRYSGIWTVMDTGPAVQGRVIDLYLWSCKDALEFGRRPVRVTVLRLGWNPEMSTPGVIDPAFRQRERRAAPRPPAGSADGPPPNRF